MSLEKIREELNASWKNLPAADLCMRILDYVENTPREELRFLTYMNLSMAAGLKEINGDLLAAVNMLTSSNLALLDAHALFIDDDEEEFEIPTNDLANALLTGEFTHPETGELVPDYEKHVIPFFAPTERLLDELK